MELAEVLNVLQQELVEALQGLLLHGALTVHHHWHGPPQPGFLYGDACWVGL